MRTVFADTGYWIAMFNPHDQWHQRVKDVNEELGRFRIVTSQMVLVEFLNHMARRGQHLRDAGLSTVRSLAKDPDVEIVPQSSDQFDSAVDFYSSRMDKDWGLTDCASFLIMEDLDMRGALAHDRNFQQAGFVALLREP